MAEALKIIYQNKDWITIVFLVILVVLTITKVVYNERLSHTNVFFLSRKYLSIYFNKEKRKLLNGFQILLFSVQLLALSLLIFLTNVYFQFEVELLNFKGYILILFWVSLYYSSRYVLGLLLAYLFNFINEYSKIVFDKSNYFNNVILWLLPFLILSVYSRYYNKLFFEITAMLFVFLLIVRYVLMLIMNKKLIFNNLFYFILYICALEIAPLIIVLKLTF
ncbi:hypothetical protein Lupro_08130 [Lutibacter profundi]|uniref:DUF4271 domain-containing protein n=1 Tax=Lutibacter profundi TaxID=1622118 RepID=A0A0X8G714_9FLAO|nr:hypothetical protein Lupro_08130 [Lutibacter profundi]